VATASSTCSVCKSRKGKRVCPVEGAICPQCCANGREETIDCPVNCEYLVESREHQKQQPLDRSLHRELFPSQDFIGENQELFSVLCVALFTAALDVPEQDTPLAANGVNACLDRDLHDCLEGAIVHCRAKAAGLEMSEIPANPVAARILAAFLQRIDHLQGQSLAENRGAVPWSDILKMVVFLRVFGQAQDNGRRKGRAFFHFVAATAMQFAPEDAFAPNEDQAPTNLIL
jgi:hypothetical protein